MNVNVNFFDWMRNGVKQSVLLGVSDAIETMGTMITFSVNGTEVHSMEKGDLPTDGIVGFRVNHGLNLHISSLDVVEAAG